jgi:hypothetical protein
MIFYALSFRASRAQRGKTRNRYPRIVIMDFGFAPLARPE